MVSKPPAEKDVDLELVAALLRDQHPDLSGLELRVSEGGWDNHMFRLGESLAVRLPRRQLAVGLVELEQRWLPVFAERLSVAIPAPVRRGRPSPRFEWPWSVVPWIEGQMTGLAPLTADQAGPFGAFLDQLHQHPPPDAPHNPYRGVPLANHRGVIEERLAKLRVQAPELDHVGLARTLSEALAAPLDREPSWLHGDLHPRNVLSGAAGVLAGVVDWGDVCAGDPATDLAAAWMHFEPDAHPDLWAAYRRPLSPSTQARARGWALMLGSIMLLAGLGGDAVFERAGRRTLERLATT